MNDEKNRVVVKFVTDVDGKTESVQIYISNLEDIDPNPGEFLLLFRIEWRISNLTLRKTSRAP